MTRRHEQVPDLGIDTSPRATWRLNPPRRKSPRAHPLAVVLGGLFKLCCAIAVLLAGGFAIILLLVIIRNLLTPRVVYVPVEAPVSSAPDYRTGQEERDEADHRAALALQAQGDADEAKDRRIRESSRLINHAMDLLDAEDVEGGRVQAFLQWTHGHYFSAIVEDGVLHEYGGEDRYRWATATPEALAALWAARDRDGRWEAISATREAFSLSAVVVDRARGRRWRLDMNGFGPGGGTAVVEMTPDVP